MAAKPKRGQDCKTEAELRKLIPERRKDRNSNYCAFCGKSGGSSIGNYTYSQTHHYHWWHCRNCGKDYDLIIQEHTLPAGMKSPFDKSKKGDSKKPQQKSMF